MTFVVALSQHTGSHQELNLLKVDASQAIVPTKQFFFGFRKIEVGFVTSCDGSIQNLDTFRQIGLTIGLRCGQVVVGVNLSDDGGHGGIILYSTHC